MRSVCFVKRLEWDVPGTVCRHAIAIGDVDNDLENELVIGNTNGELFIFKGEELWQKITNLGFITCVAIGDIFNYGRNALVVVGGDGWVYIYYSPKPVHPSRSSFSGSKKSGQLSLDSNMLSSSLSASTHTSNVVTNPQHNQHDEFCGDSCKKIERVYVQRIPPNTKVVLVADVDQDGANEMVIGLTDRVVRSYRWSSSVDLDTGRLVGLNKWECANQIGCITLQHSANGTPTLLVAQPGGTLMKIKCNPDDCYGDGSSDNSEVASSYVDYQTLQNAQLRNPSISTEVVGDLRTKNIDNEQPYDEIPDFVMPEETVEEKESPTSALETVDQVDGNLLMGGNVILGEDETRVKSKFLLGNLKDFVDSQNNANFDQLRFSSTLESRKDSVTGSENDSEKFKSLPKPYALATLDGTIMLMKEENISWAMQVDHHLFALCRLDVTGNGADEIIACAWDGQTYILDQNQNCVRFQFEEPVMAFCTGFYNAEQTTAVPCFIYKTFNNKVFLYYDVTLNSMTLKSLNPEKLLEPNQKEILYKMIDSNDKEKDKNLRELTRWLLYRPTKSYDQ